MITSGYLKKITGVALILLFVGLFTGYVFKFNNAIITEATSSGMFPEYPNQKKVGVNGQKTTAQPEGIDRGKKTNFRKKETVVKEEENLTGHINDVPVVQEIFLAGNPEAQSENSGSFNVMRSIGEPMEPMTYEEIISIEVYQATSGMVTADAGLPYPPSVPAGEPVDYYEIVDIGSYKAVDDLYEDNSEIVKEIGVFRPADPTGNYF